MTMVELKRHIFAIADENNLEVTNLQLQKTMFLAFCGIVQHFGPNHQIVRETYDVSFERWMYGPVIESEYYRYSHFGKDPIVTNEGELNETFSNIPGLNDLVIEILQMDPFQLVDITHRMKSWSDYEDDIINRNYIEPYSIEEINRDLVQR